MNEEDWQEIVGLIQEELRNIGQDNIANLSNYEIREGDERFLPSAKYIATEMLRALERDLSVRSTATVQNSLSRLNKLIENEDRTLEALVWFNQEQSKLEGKPESIPLREDEVAQEAVKELRELISQIEHIGSEKDDQ